MSKQCIVCISIIFVLLSVSNAVFSLTSKSNINTQSLEDYQNLSETIQALDITQKKYQKKLLTLNNPQKNKSHPKLPSLAENNLKKEYAIFIDYLAFQIHNYCTKIVNDFGEQAIKDLPCSVNVHKNSSNNYQTSEEKVTSLDDELMTALGEFDEMLLSEEQEIAQKKINSTYKKQQTSSRENNKELTRKEKNKEQKNSESRGRGNQKKAQSGSRKREKLDKIEDDIVAKQIKEAAEKESDPELKKRLWEEYYKYKSTNGKR